MANYIVCPAFSITFDTGIKVKADSEQEAKQKVLDMWNVDGTLTLHSVDFDASDEPAEQSTDAMLMKVNGEVVHCFDDFATIDYEIDKTFAQEV